jgi:hypothetical protein
MWLEMVIQYSAGELPLDLNVSSIEMNSPSSHEICFTVVLERWSDDADRACEETGKLEWAFQIEAWSRNKSPTSGSPLSVSAHYWAIIDSCWQCVFTISESVFNVLQLANVFIQL